MTDIQSLQNEHRRMSEELSALRSMHLGVIKSVGTLCTELKVLSTLVTTANTRYEEMRGSIKEHSAQIKALEQSQAANAYFIDLVKSINRWVVIASLSAAGALSCALYVLVQ